MKELKKIYHKIKELLANKRTRAFTVFGLYCIFIIFVIFFVRSVATTNRNPKPTPNPPQIEALTAFSGLRNYEVEMQINYPKKQDKNYTLVGSVLNQEKLFTIGDKHYYQNESLFYIEQNSIYYLTNEITFDKLLEPEKIVKLINKGVLKSKSEDYETKVITKEIAINAIEYPELDISIYKTDGTIIIEISEFENQIQKISFHFLDVYEISQEKTMTIDYHHKGDVKPFEVNIDDTRGE